MQGTEVKYWLWEVTVSATKWMQNERIVPVGIVTVRARSQKEAMSLALDYIGKNRDLCMCATSAQGEPKSLEGEAAPGYETIFRGMTK